MGPASEPRILPRSLPALPDDVDAILYLGLGGAGTLSTFLNQYQQFRRPRRHLLGGPRSWSTRPFFFGQGARPRNAPIIGNESSASGQGARPTPLGGIPALASFRERLSGGFFPPAGRRRFPSPSPACDQLLWFRRWALISPRSGK